MGDIDDEIAATEAEVVRLCAKLGHDSLSIGVGACGCENGTCHIPFHRCARCGYCDYGINKEADEIRRRCELGDPQITPIT